MQAIPKNVIPFRFDGNNHRYNNVDVAAGFKPKAVVALAEAEIARLAHTAVQPLVGKQIQDAKDYLLNRKEYYKGHGLNLRDYTIFCFGVNVGLRCGDLLSLRICDVTGARACRALAGKDIVESIGMREKKTKKGREIFLKPQVRQLLADYLNSTPGWEPGWYLFHGVWPERKPFVQMGRHNLNKVMKDIEEGLGLDVPLGTHSLRKTFARAVFDRRTADGDMLAIEALKEVLGHSSTEITRRYIGLQREAIRDVYLDGEMI